MSIESHFAPTPQHGAAWNILLQEIIPNTITNDASLEAVLQRLAEVNKWADTQGRDVRVAYHWATAQVEKQVRDVASAWANRRRVVAAAEALPRPPKSGAER